MSGGRTVLVANPSPDVYGSDLQMLESLAALTAAGHRVVVAMPADGPLSARIVERGGETDHVRFPVLRRANQSPAGFARMVAEAALSLPRLVRYIRRLRPDAVYVNTVTLPWWLLASRIAGAKTICHVHEAETTDSALVRRALVLPLRLAHSVIAISRTAVDAMVAADPGLDARIHMVYNGVPQPPDLPQPAPRQRPLRLVVVGRLSPRKAPHLALEALALLRSRGYDLALELVGTPFTGYEWYLDQLKERAAAPDLAGSVTFAGYCSPVWANLARADIMVAPCQRETFGNAVVEAQFALRPVVANGAGGHTETITDGETGLLVQSEDVPALAEAIARLVDDDALARDIAEKARSEAIRRFSVDGYGAEVVALVEGLTDGAPA